MSFSMSDLGASELNEVGAALRSPEDLGNNPGLEMQWAMKAMEHANIHYNIITSVDASCLKLTQVDDKIYERFREEYPDLSVTKLNENEMKSPEAKKKWRDFMESFKGEIEDYNLGTLLRLSCEEDYSPENTMFSVRTQFLAIEIARNKEGHNSCLYRKKQQKAPEAVS